MESNRFNRLSSTHFNTDELKLTPICYDSVGGGGVRTLKLIQNHLVFMGTQRSCVIVLINARRGLKLPFMPRDIWDNFNLWSTEGTDALTGAAGGL